MDANMNFTERLVSSVQIINKMLVGCRADAPAKDPPFTKGIQTIAVM